MGGVVAAGHPVSAEAGAQALRDGGNAVDAAVAAVLMSFVAESPLTGPGAGGFMLVHTPAGEDHLLDFFVAAPGKGLDELAPCELEPVEVHFTQDAVQVFNVGPASCGVPGTMAGVATAAERFGTMTLAELCAPAARAAREGVEVVPIQAYLFRILEPILTGSPQGAAIYAPEGRLLAEGETVRLPDLADLIDRLGAEGPAFAYTGDLAATVATWIGERGGLLTAEDLATYEVIEREPARAHYRGREILTNPPPSSGGILIAYALDLLERLGRPAGFPALVEAMSRANQARTEEFLTGLHTEGYLERFLAEEAARASRLGSTTHIAAMDDEGSCASVTCSNGSSSGVIVPGTGLHLNNMLGEEDLNPLGFHRHAPGLRVPSMMAPTVVLRDGEPEIALGSAGSNRIRSAILQTILGIADLGLAAPEAVERARIHLERDVIEAEPGVPEEELRQLEDAGWTVERWTERNLYFGGVQAVARDLQTRRLSGGGDPRRGGAVVSA